ncbi:hypothetical protein F8M41_013183 [Gigaspora margarita]|uniref:Uncharacterized protein n=1 Tax=Gigaspora margarita TaxID=4874 RepID=A0A8H3WY24_GIGMA|nr:hypothetical protein F8M41_013183 [Gigaspora margarita]
MEYYEKSNKCFFEEDNISYYNETGIYSSEELDDQNSCEFTFKASSNCNSCDELSSNDKSSSNSLLTSVKNEFFDDIANKALDSDKLSQNIGDFLLYFENTTIVLMFS